MSLGVSVDPCAPTICPSVNPIPVPAPKVGIGFNPLMQQQIFNVSLALQQFISQCEYTLQQLNQASHVEMADMTTSNTSFSGAMISSHSRSVNYRAASQVDGLQREIVRINQMVEGLRQEALRVNDTAFASRFFLSLPTDLSGAHIRNAENAEHSFFWDLFSNDAYSTWGSANTLREIQFTADRVRHARCQAQSLLTSLSSPHCGNIPF